jgi:predicted protein tyrosine phosphatase
MELKIKGHESIEGLIKGENYRQYDVVLFTNSNKSAPRIIETHAKDLIHFAKDDCDQDSEKYGWKAMTEDDVRKLLDWTKDRERIICCCHAGVSRSSATAYVLACREWGPEAALTVLRPFKHWPNRLIVHLGAIVLGDRKVWEMFRKWQLDNTGVDPRQDFGGIYLKWERENELPS